MKILMIGTTSIGYVRDNWLNPIREMYDLTYIPYDTLLRAMGKDRLNSYIRHVCDRGFDYVFFYPDGRGQMFSEELFGILKDERKVVFHSDDAGGVWFRNCSKYDYRYDFVVTSSKEGYMKRTESEGYKGNACYVPWGYNDSIYFKKDGEKKDTDVVFLGSNFERDGEYFLDGEFRQALLTRLYEASVKHGFSLKLYGAGWDRHPVLNACYAGFADAGEVNGILNRARIILGLGYTIDREPTYQTKLKHFENSGTGSFQLVNENPELEELFGDSLGYFKDADDMVDKVLYYLKHEEEREEKADRAYRICMEESTISERIRELFSKAGDFFGHKPEEGCAPGRLRIGVLRGEEASDKPDPKDYDYVRFEDDVMCFDYNETVIPDEYRPGGELPKVLTVSFYVSFCDRKELEDSRIIRRTSGPDTEVIPPSFRHEDLVYADEIVKRFTCHEEDGVFYPMADYLIRSDALDDVLSEIKSGNLGSLKEAVRAEAVCGDYIIPEESFVKQRYHEYFKDILSRNECVAVYGLSGYVFDLWDEWIKTNGAPSNVVYVDRNWAGKKKDGIECVDLESLLEGRVRPSAVLVMAIFAGEEISGLLAPIKDRTEIVKMYDMNTYKRKQGGLA